MEQLAPSRSRSGAGSFAWRRGAEGPRCPRSFSLSISVGLGFLGLLLNLVGGLLVLLADFVELLHVLEEVGAPAQRNEQLGLLAIAAVVRGLHSNGLGANLVERSILVPAAQNESITNFQICRPTSAKKPRLNSSLSLESSRKISD
jgi:hypothetical protein